MQQFILDYMLLSGHSLKLRQELDKRKCTLEYFKTEILTPQN